MFFSVVFPAESKSAVKLNRLNVISLRKGRIYSSIIFLFNVMRDCLHCPRPITEIEINDSIHNVQSCQEWSITARDPGSEIRNF